MASLSHSVQDATPTKEGKVKDDMLVGSVAITIPSETKAAVAHTTTTLRSFVGTRHFSPDPSTQYFPLADPHPNRRVAVLVPFYNEDAADMRRTLEGLASHALELKELGVVMCAVAVMDGWHKASHAMHAYLRTLFPGSVEVDGTSKPWWEVAESIGPAQSEAGVATHVVENVATVNQKGDGSIKVGPPATVGVKLENGMYLELSLIVKMDNRKKHNSHEWFLRSHGPAHGAQYVLTTDCGTVFEAGSMCKFVRYMDSHSQCSGLTGRLRCMSARQQGCEGEGLIAKLNRACQRVDYETVSFLFPFYRLAGTMPCLHGPCGFFQLSDIQGEAIEYYFGLLNAHPDHVGIFHGNLVMAEDRVLSIAAFTQTGKYTTWLPDAVFYCEAETDTYRLLAQRRRWTNGALAGFLWLLGGAGMVKPGAVTNKFYMFLRYMSSLLTSAMFVLEVATGALTAAFFLFVVWATLLTAFPTWPMWAYDAVVFSIMGLWFSFTVVHMFTKFVRPFYYFMLVLGAVLAALITASAWRGFALVFEGKREMGVPQYYALIAIVCPLLFSLFSGTSSFVITATNIIPAILMEPTFNGLFRMYSFARTWDVTWGSRPPAPLASTSELPTYTSENELEPPQQAKKKPLVPRIPTKVQGVLIAVLVLVSNGLVFVFLRPSLQLIASGRWALIFMCLQPSAILHVCASFVFYMWYTPHTIYKTAKGVARRWRQRPIHRQNEAWSPSARSSIMSQV